MVGSVLFSYLLASLFSALIVGLGLWCLTRLKQQAPQSQSPPEPKGSITSIYLFKSGALSDANSVALDEIGSGILSSYTWNDLSRSLTDQFPGFPMSQGVDSEAESVIIHSRDPADNATVTIDQWDTVARVIVRRCAGSPEKDGNIDCRAMFEAPNPIWQTDEKGLITWTNSAYDALADRLDRPVEAAQTPVFELGENDSDDQPIRVGLVDTARDQTYWYEVQKVISKGHTMFYATNASAIVSAEIAQRNFVQTLTKTFAQLSIGLAIFDRNRQLALFNPALIDLTILPADFLSGRPSLLSFFDRMRENRVMPEPKNYSSWREQIAELVVAATDGRYSETWSLPSGLTYRVTGRPHPDGAIAFLFEDISAEISLTRRFRADLELGQSVVDALDSAVAVFSSTGSLNQCNRAYRELWRTDPDKSIAEYTFRDALPAWKEECQPSDIWDHIRQTVLSNQHRESWRDSVLMKNGTLCHIQVRPVHRGATMVSFDLETQKNALIQPVPALT